MKSITNILGIILIVLGLVGLAYGGFNYTTQDKVAQVGDVKITADNEKRVSFPPLTAGAALVVGLVLVFIARRK